MDSLNENTATAGDDYGRKYKSKTIKHVKVPPLGLPNLRTGIHYFVLNKGLLPSSLPHHFFFSLVSFCENEMLKISYSLVILMINGRRGTKGTGIPKILKMHLN